MGRDYLKIKQRYGLVLLKLLQTHNSLKITRLTQFWQPKGVPELWNRVKKKKGVGRYLQGRAATNSLKSSRRLPNPSIHPVLLHSSPKAVLYVQALTRGNFQKVAYVQCFHVCPCTICRVYVWWSPLICLHQKQERMFAEHCICSAPTLLNERRKWKSLIVTKHYYLFLNIIRDYKSSSENFFFYTILTEHIRADNKTSILNRFLHCTLQQNTLVKSATCDT